MSSAASIATSPEAISQAFDQSPDVQRLPSMYGLGPLP
jgi:hypothetical protein